MADVVVMLAQTLRTWARELHMHVMDHGGAVVRGYAMTPADLSEEIDVFVVDDVTSYLSASLVAGLHARGVAVAGMYDGEGDDEGRARLLATGVDVALSAQTPPELIVAELFRLRRGRRGNEVAEAASAPGSPGAVVAVGSAGGGCGSTEVAISLAAALSRRGRDAVLVDADDQSPGLAGRLGLAGLPNLTSALDAFRAGRPSRDHVRFLPETGYGVVTGIAVQGDWVELRPDEVVQLLVALGAERRVVVANIGGRVEALPGMGRTARFGTARAVMGAADAVVLVSTASPRGIRLAAEWAVAAAGLVGMSRVDLVLNLHAGGSFTSGELVGAASELRPGSVTVVPYDRRVLRAEWDGGVVGAGPFYRRTTRLAARLAERLA